MAKLLKSVFGKKNQPPRDFIGGRPYDDYCSNSVGDLTTDNPIQPAGSLGSFHQAGLASSGSNQQYKNDIHQTSDRYRHHSTEDEGAGITDDFVYRGAGALNLVTNGNRRRSDAADRDGYRRTELGETKSPTSKKPIMTEDYSDPKDVLKDLKESGIVIPPEKPDMPPHQPYPEDDYSVPYEAQKMIRKMRESGEAKSEAKHRKGSRHSDEAESWNVPNNPKDRYKHHTYEEPPDVSPPIHRPETPDSYVGESSDELNGHSPSLSPSPLRQHSGYSRDHSSSPMSSESADDSFPPMHHSSGNAAPLQNHRHQTPQHDQRAATEYDNPWEWSSSAMKMARLGQGVKSGPGQSPEPLDSPRGRTRSELPPTSANRGMVRTSPESDTRPGDEYDEPWEWMPLNRKFSQAVTEKEKHHAGRISPLPETPSSRGNNNKKPMKLDIKAKPSTALAEHVEVSLPLEHQAWYHGKLSRSDAEKKLRSCKEGSYLVRQSESAARDYSLSLKSAKGFMHMKIVHHPEGYILGEYSKPLRTIPQMIFYYTQHKLNIRGAEHMALLHPVADQLL